VYIKRCGQTKARKHGCYWQLVESYRTSAGPRLRVVAYLADVSVGKRAGALKAARHATGWQSRLFDDEESSSWWRWMPGGVGVEVEGVKDFGGSWLGLEISERLGFIQFRLTCGTAEVGSAQRVVPGACGRDGLPSPARRSPSFALTANISQHPVNLLSADELHRIG
jgi:hypothetical protein